MPEINLRVKIICGKRTPLEVYAESMAVNTKTLVTQDGVKFTDLEVEAVVDNAIVEFIQNLKKEN